MTHNRTFRAFRVIAVSILLMPFPIVTAQSQTITIATGELPPYTAAESPHGGYINHIISTAFAEVGIETQFHYLPWARAYKDAGDGVYVASAYWYKDVKHNSEFYHSDTMIRDRVVFFRKKSSVQVSNFEDIKRLRLRLGLTRGYTYNDDIWQWANENKRLVSVVNSDIQNLQMLVLGRIDIVPVDEISGWYALQKHFSTEQVKTIETVAQDLLNREATLLFSKAHPQASAFLEPFNQGLKLIQQKGLLEDMKLKFVSGFYSEQSRD